MSEPQYHKISKKSLTKFHQHLLKKYGDRQIAQSILISEIKDRLGIGQVTEFTELLLYLVKKGIIIIEKNNEALIIHLCEESSKK